MRSKLFFWFLGFILLADVAGAQEFTTTNFKVLDPVLTSAGYSSSASYGLWGNVSQLGIGTSTATSFGVNSGFLFFPFVSTPAVSATAGDSQVDLSWSAATAALGFSISGYTVGQSTVAGGPYSYTSVGNVTAAARSGLTNGTTYYFVLRMQDAFSNFIATSTEVSATPAAAGGGGGGGGGGSSGGGSASVTGVELSGRAYPLSKVSILQDGQVVLTTIAGPDARFAALITGMSAGNYLFAVRGEDLAGRQSSLFTFPVYVTAGAKTTISGIFLAPTIDLDKSEVKRGDNLAILGQTAPNGLVTIAVNSLQPIFAQTKAQADGIYLYNLDTAVLEFGQHSAKSKTAVAEEISPFGPVVSFKVGLKNVDDTPRGCPPRADLNNDCRVNLIDFSIAAFWYHRPLSDSFRVREQALLNGDGQVDLVDFSIMAYYWTG